MEIDDGGPAFGQVVELQCVRVSPFDGEEWEPALVDSGMSLRDYFAAKAMTLRFGQAGTSLDVHQMAAKCYEMADAMIAARKVPNEPTQGRR